MTCVSGPLISARNPQTQLFSGSSLMQVDQCLSSKNLLMSTTYQGKVKALKYKRPFTVQASADGGRPSSASIFVGGFVLGGIVVGALGCIYAPQISKALAGADRKDLMRKLPKFIYDEEKALELTFIIYYDFFFGHPLSKSYPWLEFVSVPQFLVICFILCCIVSFFFLNPATLHQPKMMMMMMMMIKQETRKILTEKIAQLNSAIDDVSSQLRADDTPNGTAVSPDELEASI
ncbi:hypothetical protein CsSME_00006077 [Camellia sinensis var. sinensis]